MLRQFIGKEHSISVVKSYWDSNGGSVTIEAEANTIKYTASIYRYSLADGIDSSMGLPKASSGSSSLRSLSTGTQTHSPFVSGTFTLAYGASSKEFSYGVGASTVESWIRGLDTALANVEVYRTVAKGWNCDYGCTWIIQYEGAKLAANGNTIDILITANTLSGASTTPTIARSIRRNFSTNQLISPIDYQLMRTAGTMHPVEVTVNSIPAVCSTNCGYQFKDTGKVTALSRSGTALTLTISDPLATGYTLTNVYVSVAGQNCGIDTSVGSIASFNCEMALNTDNTPILLGDSVTPRVFVVGGGLLPLETGVNPISQTLAASSATSSINGNNGGYLVTVAGTGFPLDVADATVTICTKTARIDSISNIQLVFEMPICSTPGAQTISIASTHAAAPATVSFTLSDASLTQPTITAATPSSANPGVKQKMTITGTNFGSSKSDLTVTLRNTTTNEVKYNMRVLSVSAGGDSIVAGLPGGVAGTFQLVVFVAGKGNSFSPNGSDMFTYEVNVTSISPTSGNFYGGTLLTVTGINFDPTPQQTLVFLGDQLNQFCSIESVTATEIKCRTPAMHQWDVDDGSFTQKLVVTTRLVHVSACDGSCDFTYTAKDSSPNITAISPTTLTSGSSLTLTGTDLNDAACDVALVNSADSTDVHVSSASTCTATSVSASLTGVPAGNYNARVRTLNGETNPIAVTVNWDKGTVTSGTSQSGVFVNFAGAKGWPAALSSSYTIQAEKPGELVAHEVVSCCSSGNVKIKLPAAAASTVYTLTFTSPSNTLTQTVTVSSDPKVTLSTSMPVSAGTVSLSISTKPVTQVRVVSKANPSIEATVSNLAGSGSTYTFDADLKVGAYQIFANGDDDVYGCDTDVDVQKAASLTATASPVDTSFNGGEFKITGANLGAASYITVNGKRGDFVSATASEATYKVPPLVTANAQSNFNNKLAHQVANIPQSQFTTFGSNAMGQAYAFDGTHSSSYSSVPDAGTGNICWLGVDFGADYQAEVARVRFFPKAVESGAVIKTFLGGEIQGSNDMSTWTKLADVTQTVKSGWNTRISSNSTSFRYVRYKHDINSNCSLAEFEVWGVVYNKMAATLAGQASDVVYMDGFSSNEQTFAGAISYKATSTPVIDTITPWYGDINGGYEITLEGSNLNHATASIWIDGIECTSAASVNASAIKCTVGARPTIPSENTFVATFGGNNAIINSEFVYVLKWSDDATWGTDVPPVKGDLVAVPKGMALLIDQNIPNALEGIAVENGTLIVADDQALEIHTGFITLVGGRFIAGTEARPHQNNLKFVMYGGYYGRQQPTFGNKGIGCLDCNFSMYGKPRPQTWTRLAAPATAGNNWIEVEDASDWAAGEEIVIASTSFNHYEAEQMTIQSVAGNNLTLTSKLEYTHVWTSE